MNNNPPYMAWRVKEKIEVMIGKDNDHAYPLFPDDELYKNSDGTFNKVAPGLCIAGIVLQEDQVEEYEETRYWSI